MTDPMRWGDGMLHFGDALDCDYPWLPPSKIDDYATSVRLVGRKVEEVERDLILETLTHCLGNRTRAAEILGISIRTLRNKLHEYRAQGAEVPGQTAVFQPYAMAG